MDKRHGHEESGRPEKASDPRLGSAVDSAVAVAVTHAPPASWDLRLPASSLLGRAHDSVLLCMTLLVKEHECVPRIGGECRVLGRPQWL